MLTIIVTSHSVYPWSVICALNTGIWSRGIDTNANKWKLIYEFKWITNNLSYIIFWVSNYIVISLHHYVHTNVCFTCNSCNSMSQHWKYWQYPILCTSGNEPNVTFTPEQIKHHSKWDQPLNSSLEDYIEHLFT